MNRRLRALLVAFAVLASLMTGVDSASAASGRVIIPKIGVNAPIVPKGVKNQVLQVGNNPWAWYTQRGGDPPCDSTGSTSYTGHAWRSGNGVADRLLQLRRGDIITVAGCKFRVTSVQVWKMSRGIGSFTSSTGPGRIVMAGCKADDYSRRTVVFARKI